MTSIHFLAPLALSIALISCGSQADMYDTSDSYATQDASASVEPAAAPENPIYDTPAVYEESSAAPAIQSAASEVPATAAVAPIGVATTSHTVVKGDTLSGISKKYRVPIESIKQANNMSNDIVVLGRVMKIPAP